MANIKCIDVSEWQGTIDWKKVKSAGYGHAILRAGFGRSATQKDKTFETNYKNAKAAGVKLGVYWYSYAVDKTDAVNEANACIQVLKSKSLDMPVFFDMEESSMTKLGKSALTEMAKAFCNTLIKAGYKAGVYSNPNWFTNYLDYKALRKLYPIWLAQYYVEPQYDCDVWQYSSQGKVSGITGNVDMNVIYNSDIVKSSAVKPTEPDTPQAKEVLETAALQALLRQAYALGIVKTLVTPIDNKKGKLTNGAVIEAREYLGYQNPTSSVDIKLITDLDTAVSAKLSELLSRQAGDINGDGSVDIKDATEIQRKVAGL
ncbi:MAG: hypothetical protein IJ298_09405 [Ruminococcus sp.]|nr:hypothetical protein [Ruminococcus sp.]